MLAGERRGHEFRCDRQLHDEPGANRLIFLDADGPAVVFDDATDNGQAQSGSPFLGGEVGQEEPLFQLLGDPVAVSATAISIASRLATSEVEI